MRTFLEWVGTQGKAPTVYQITYLRNVESIFASKLVAAGGSSAWQKPHIQSHSRQGVFFCSNPQCAKNWIEALADQAFNISDHPIEEEFVPVILKFKINRNAWTPDSLGNAETPNNYYTKRNIDPAGLQVWDGGEWSPHAEDAFRLKYIWDCEEDMLDIQNYPFPTSWE